MNPTEGNIDLFWVVRIYWLVSNGP